MTRRQTLIAFDFDHTIVEENSDIVARKLINMDLIPEAVRKLYQTRGWTDYMAEIFKLLHKHKISEDTISEAMRKMIPTEKMPELLQWLREEGHEIIIISDSNSMFIDEWLRYNNLSDCVARVFTNPASFDESGLLVIKPYHDQDWCDLSTRNLCKGYILETHIRERLDEGASFEFIAYVGDGLNDFCPSLKLCANDIVFPRAGFPLHNKIFDPKEKNKVVAGVYPWTNATDIRCAIQNRLNIPGC